MDLRHAQNDMVRAYAAGAPGVLVSGLVWLATGMAWQDGDTVRAFVVLFAGGVLIFPVSTLLARVVFKAPKADSGNPLSRLALESTFVLMAGILIGYVLLVRRPDMAIPAFSVVMGARYFTFRTIYGKLHYWALAAAICALGALALLGIALPLGNLALQVGAVEVIVSALIHASRGKQTNG